MLVHSKYSANHLYKVEIVMGPSELPCGIPQIIVCFVTQIIAAKPVYSQSRTQSSRAFWPAGERPERLWDNRLHFPRKRGFRSYDVWLSLNGSRKEKTVNSRNGGLKVFEKQEF